MEIKIDKQFIDDAVQQAVEELKQNNIWIPEGMTNGEVIEEIYRFHSDMNCGSNGEYVHVWSNDGNCQMTIHKDFWNSPYQRGGE